MSLMKRDRVEAEKANRLELTPVSRITESEEAFTLTMELPGVSEKQVELTLEDRTLTVTAEKEVASFKDYTLILNEIQEARYRAAFELPERVDTAKVQASCKNGMLVLTLPKREEVKPRRIAITAG
ncbi:MAG TPA: Hsp20/alpha crystallin family protein [Kiritimatiellia bacterium]|jgi:HSP20 family molecular chaperone IbpA|nr:Hsp20/alpha crystallin family protein [Kiritimatiellia bacterium]HOR97402.1 Hsp20/alpha crystallin family protein [Kiritimatiellia bacterium]HPK38000.1 Hsp20/alpha crystallin family protein [Kiritimatiellia bacterium]HPW75941.1 Hsp20/alpha crystallin family protein [Kiritimatiellia bacterium]HRU19749.1 Hsp20/alpha crystallin family protein [Kiritimatiellia bacterium]